MTTASEGDEVLRDDDDVAGGTLLGRMVSAGIDESRARERISQGRIQVDGEIIDDPGAPTPWPSRWVVNPAN